MGRQADRCTKVQTEQAIQRQQRGHTASFEDLHPIADALIGGLALAAFVIGAIFMLVSEGAGL